jgi:hypothetical protein
MTKRISKKSSEPASMRSSTAAAKPAQTKKEQMLALLRREGGATLNEIVGLTGWLPHTTRAVFTGLRKKGFALDRSRTGGVTRYAIKAEPVT